MKFIVCITAGTVLGYWLGQHYNLDIAIEEKGEEL